MASYSDYGARRGQTGSKYLQDIIDKQKGINKDKKQGADDTPVVKKKQGVDTPKKEVSIKEREKRKHELMKSGLTGQEAEAKAKKEIREVEEKKRGFETPEQEKIRLIKEEKEAELAEVGIPRAENISETTSNIAGEQGENIFGVTTGVSAASAGQLIIKNFQGNPELQAEVLALTEYMIINNLTPEQVTDDPLEQALLRLKLNENDIKVLNNGKTDVSNLASSIEGLPIASAFTKYTGGAVTPTSAYAKITDLDAQVMKLTSKMDNWGEAITKNPQLADEYDDLVDETVQKVLDAQSRIKLMIIQSPILQNSPEEVELIQENLDRALTKSIKLKSTIIQTRYT